MRKDANPQRRWPTPDILCRARFVDDAGPIRFVDTEAAARYLALEAHTLECYRSLGGGPAYHKFGKWGFSKRNKYGYCTGRNIYL